MLTDKDSLVKQTATRGVLALALAASVLATPLAVQPVAAAETGLTLDALKAGTVVTDKTVPGVTRTTYSASPSGPWNVNVVVIDPDQAPLTLKGTYGTGLSTAQKSSLMLQAVSVNTLRMPRVGVNGAFFDGNMNDPSGSNDGDVAGILVRGGKLLSEANKGKGAAPVGSALILQHGRPYITELSTTLTVKPRNSAVPARRLDGINRLPGRSAHCEGTDTAVDPDETMDGNGVCWDPSEIISFTPEYGGTTPTTAYTTASNDPDHPSDQVTISNDEGIELLLDATGTVTSCYDSAPVAGSTCQTGDRGGRTVPSGGRILQGIGEGADWLRANAPAGTALDLSETVIDTRFGDTIALDPSMYVTSGGDLLMRDGAVVYTQPPAPYVPDEAPRTAIGVDGWGRMMMVTVDGRSAASKGATRLELANLLKDLGAVDALNMDGGGSTTLVRQNTVVNQPSDPSGERMVGDSVYAGAGGYPLP